MGVLVSSCHPVREESVRNPYPECSPMKPDLEKLKKQALQSVELSSRDKDSVVNADLQKMITAIKSVAKKKDLVVMVFER